MVHERDGYIGEGKNGENREEKEIVYRHPASLTPSNGSARIHALTNAIVTRYPRIPVLATHDRTKTAKEHETRFASQKPDAP